MCRAQVEVKALAWGSDLVDETEGGGRASRHPSSRPFSDPKPSLSTNGIVLHVTINISSQRGHQSTTLPYPSTEALGQNPESGAVYDVVLLSEVNWACRACVFSFSPG